MTAILAAMAAGAVVYRVLVGLVRLVWFVRSADVRRAQAEDAAASVERRVKEADARTELVEQALKLAVEDKQAFMRRLELVAAEGSKPLKCGGNVHDVRCKDYAPAKRPVVNKPAPVTWVEGEPSWACQTCGHHNGEHAEWCGRKT